MSKKKVITFKLGDSVLGTLLGLPIAVLIYTMLFAVLTMVALVICSPLIILGLLIWWLT